MKTRFVIGVVLFTAFAFGQTTKPATPKSGGTVPTKSGSAPKSASAAKAGAAGLPSRATVTAFLHQVFGWEPEVKVAVKDIKWSPAPTIAEIDLHADTPKGPEESVMYVTSDHKTVISGGQMFPFGGQAGVKPSNEQIDAFVRQMTSGNPGITWSVLAVKPNALSNLTEVTVGLASPQGQRGTQRFWVTTDGQHALLGDPSPFGADPYAPARAQLAKGLNGPARGSATSPMRLVEFGDLECPACKSAAPIIERLLKDEPTAHFVFQQFPLTKIHHWAYKAALYGDCIARQDNAAFWKFMDAVYGAQEDISARVESSDPNKKPDLTYAEQKLNEIAGQLGMNAKQIAACSAEAATASRIDRSMAVGNAMEVQSTPTLFVNGRRVSNIGGMPYDALKRMVEFMGKPAK